jgi:disulfide bond formation protein DsbB
MFDRACKYFETPVNFLALLIAVSAGALAAAIGSQTIGGLEPCILCLYQRVPFWVVLGLSVTGLLLVKNGRAVKAIIVLCAIAFLINVGIAFYHSGVELEWWVSAVEGCKVPMADEDPNWIDKIITKAAVPCSAIQWKDPVLGLTMANYNIVLNFVMFLVCAMVLRKKKA